MPFVDRNRFPYSLLRRPWVYNLSQQVFWSRAARRRVFTEFVKCSPGDRVLDFGCGTGQALTHLPSVRYVGIDLNAEYIEIARATHGTAGEFLAGELDSLPIPPYDHFDVVLILAVLHHLSDEVAESVLSGARQRLRPGGRLITLDPVFSPGQGYLDRWIVSRDRGQYVRTQAATEELARPHFQRVTSRIVRGLLRVPYSLIFLECHA